MPELDMRSLFRAMRTLVAGALVAACLYSCRQGFSIDEGISGKAFMEAVKMGDGRKAALLIQEGVYTEVRDSKGDTPLLYCVRTGNTRLVEMLLRSGVLKDARTVNGKGALELAVDSGNMEMMSCLLDRGISPDEVCHDNNPIFLKAVRFGDMETVKLLLRHGVSANTVGKDGQTALHIAARDGLMQYMDLMLAAGVNPDVRNDDGLTPLWAAAGASGPVERWQGIQRLLEAGAHGDSPGKDGETLLNLAIRGGLYDEAVELINHGAEVSGAHNGAPAPIEVALESGREDMIELLLSRGVDGVALLDDVDLAELCLQYGANPHAPGREGRAPLHMAIAAGDASMVDLLLQYGADPSSLGKEGQTPLHMAIAVGSGPMVSTLLRHGVDPNAYFKRPVSKAFLELAKQDSMKWFLSYERGVTPLMMAANHGDPDMIASLLKHGARKYAYTSRHRLYPLNFASRKANVKAMQVILGQDPDNEACHAVLDLSDQKVRLYNAENEVVFTSKVSTGKKGHDTPEGSYVITDKHKKHTSNIYGVSMPYFQRLSCSAFGFHYGRCPGYPASHGCIRMPYKAAKALFALTPVGTRVEIQP